MLTITTSVKKIASMSSRIRIVQGGTAGGKTISILLYLIDAAQKDTTPTLTSVVSESVPHLKRGAMRDFKNILQAQHYWQDKNWNVQDSTYTFETGSKIEFFSTDNGDKLRGARRDRCFMNEGNNCTFDAFEQLEVRTKEFFFIDYNPTNEFWAISEVLPRRKDTEFIILTYKDNEGLSQEIIDSIEQRKDRVQWWRVYGLGLLGEHEDRIYKGWLSIDAIPHEAKLVRRWVDFGYTNDPCAIGDVYEYNGGYILDELCYQRGMHNSEIASFIKAQPERTLVIADSSEPKSIDELAAYGLTVLGADKRNRGTGVSYKAWGIGLVQQQKISVTQRSLNLIKEYRNYFWMKDKNGKVLNMPQEMNDHHLDGVRYAIESLNPQYGQTATQSVGGIRSFDVYE